MKQLLLYAMLDSRFSAPSHVQHKIAKDFAERKGYAIGSYGAEDPDFIEGSPSLNEKLGQLENNYTGIIFYSAFQIQGNIIQLISNCLDRSLIVAFAAQEILIKSWQEMESFKPLFLASTYSDRNRRIAKKLRKSIA